MEDDIDMGSSVVMVGWETERIILFYGFLLTSPPAREAGYELSVKHVLPIHLPNYTRPIQANKKKTKGNLIRKIRGISLLPTVARRRW